MSADAFSHGHDTIVLYPKYTYISIFGKACEDMEVGYYMRLETGRVVGVEKVYESSMSTEISEFVRQGLTLSDGHPVNQRPQEYLLLPPPSTTRPSPLFPLLSHLQLHVPGIYKAGDVQSRDAGPITKTAQERLETGIFTECIGDRLLEILSDNMNNDCVGKVEK